MLVLLSTSSWERAGLAGAALIPGSCSYCHKASLFIYKDLNFQADVLATILQGGPVTFNLTHPYNSDKVMEKIITRTTLLARAVGL